MTTQQKNLTQGFVIEAPVTEQQNREMKPWEEAAIADLTKAIRDIENGAYGTAVRRAMDGVKEVAGAKDLTIPYV